MSLSVHLARIRRGWRCRSTSGFFGLTDDYMRDVYEQFFFLKYHGGWSFSEAYNLPIKIRHWFVDRLVKQLNDEKKAMEDQMKEIEKQSK